MPQGAARGPASPQPPACGRGARHVAERYRRAAEPAVRGIAGVVAAVAFFAAAGVVGGRGGVAIASVWVAVAGTYCLANFRHCREAHCAVTGPGWTLAALLGFAAAVTPGAGLSWYRVTAEAVVFVVVLAAGYGLEPWWRRGPGAGHYRGGKAGMPKIAETVRAARRDQIITAGLACFARTGYHATTMAEVAAQAGVSKGTPYLYFESKQALFIALHEQWDCRTADRVNAAIAALPTPGAAHPAGSCTPWPPRSPPTSLRTPRPAGC